MPALTAMHHLLRRSADRGPARTVFTRRGIDTSYEELDQRSGRLAASLRELGVQRGDRVALVLDGVVDYLVAFYGILKAGATVVPVCPDTRAATLVWTLANCRARAVVLEARNSALLEQVAAEVPALEHAIIVGAPRPGPPRLRVATSELAQLLQNGAVLHDAGAGRDDLACINYTSGTTGRPKGVMLAHRNLLANTQSIVQYLALQPTDRAGMVLPFFYVYGNSVLHTHIAVGASIAMVGSMAFPAAVLRGIQDQACTGFPGVPSTFARLVQLPALKQTDLSCLRYLTQAGGPMSPALTQELRHAIPHVRIVVMYGQTEASARLSYLPPADLERKMGSVGVAIPGVELRVLDQQGHEVPRGTVGEVVAQGDNVMIGYWDDPQATSQVLRPEGLRTGDLARMDDEGYLYIVARANDMIKSGAHRISPQEIEEVVETLDQVAQCAVVGVPDALLGEAIIAFVVPSAGAVVTARQVLHRCHQHLPRFKMPGQVRVVADLPRTATGKVQRSELKEWYRQQIGLVDH